MGDSIQSLLMKILIKNANSNLSITTYDESRVLIHRQMSIQKKIKNYRQMLRVYLLIIM